MSNRSWRCWAVAAALPLAACAPVETPASSGLRVILSTTNEWASATEVANRATRLARVPARNIVEDGPRRYYVTLDCHTEPDCRDAMARIAADRNFVLAVERDTRQRLPGRPGGEASR